MLNPPTGATFDENDDEHRRRLQSPTHQTTVGDEKDLVVSTPTISEDKPIAFSGGKPGHDDREEVEKDDGYHTPTSPRHRIPPPTKCPPAPRKPAINRKRKRADSDMEEFFLVILRCINQ